MKNYILSIILAITVSGCFFFNKPPVPNIIVINNETVDCTAVPSVYWGSRGVNPGNSTELWKCYDWELTAR